MSSTRKLWEMVIEGQQNKQQGIVNTLQHTSVPQSSVGRAECLNLDQAQAGRAGVHTLTHSALEQ